MESGYTHDMACMDAENKRKDMGWVQDMAQKVAQLTGEDQQVYVRTTYRGDIFDFEPLGIQRENVVKIVRLEDGSYVATSIQRP
jgi:hypothetical protein